MSFRCLLLTVLTLAAFAGSGCGSKPATGGEADDKAEVAPVVVELTPVASQTIQTSLTAQGAFVASQGASVKVGAISAGRIAKVLAIEGDQVAAGQVVAILDSRVQASQTQSAAAALMMAEIQAQEAALNAKSAQLDQSSAVKLAALALDTAKAERDSSVRIARLGLQSAQVELNKALAGNRVQEIAQSEQSVRQAQVVRDSAAREESRNALLLEKGIVSQKVYDDSKSALTNADASLRSAESQSSLMKEGARKEDIQVARLNVQTANQTLRNAREVGDHRVLQAETSLKQAKQGILQVQSKLQEAEANRKNVLQKSADAGAAAATQSLTEVRSPISGRVVRRLLNPGDTPDNTSPILEIVSLHSGIDFVANVPASDGAILRVGMKAIVTVKGQTSLDISGAVISAGLVDPQTSLLTFRMTFSAPPSWVRPGMFASARVVVSEHPGALVVPKRALLTRDGDSIVFVAKGNKASLVKVQVGAEQDGLTEILKGVEKGQSVVTLGNYELTDGAPIKTAGAEDKGDAKKDVDPSSKTSPKEATESDVKPTGAGSK